MGFDLRAALGTIAPTLATMLGGPLAGTAVGALEQAFGVTPPANATAQARQDAVTQVVQTSMTPDTLAAVRKADQDHAERLKQMDLDIAKLNADHDAALAATDAADRDSARKREVAVRGWTVPALAWLVVGASVALGAAIVAGIVTKDPQQATLVGTVIGYVYSEAKAVLSYFFGSSAGSAEKTRLLAQTQPIQQE